MGTTSPRSRVHYLNSAVLVLAFVAALGCCPFAVYATKGYVHTYGRMYPGGELSASWPPNIPYAGSLRYIMNERMVLLCVVELMLLGILTMKEHLALSIASRLWINLVGLVLILAVGVVSGIPMMIEIQHVKG